MSNTFSDKNGADVGPFDFNTTLGRKAAALVRSVALSTEDLAAINALGTKLDALATYVDQLEGYTDTLETLIGASNTKLDSLITQGGATADVPVEIHSPCDVINYVPTLDTSIYAANDVLAATAVISNVMRVNDGRANLLSLTGIDKSKQKPAMTILFYQTNVTSAAANAANALSDADQLTLLGFHRILAADWIDYANNSICCFKGPTGPGLLLEAATGTKDVYAVCILDAGTPTFAVGDLMFKLGVVQA